MAGRRITKRVQASVCFFGAAILLFAPGAQAITYDVSLDWTLYGDLNQNTIPVIGSMACGPTSVVNSFVYLQNSYPEIYGDSLVPDLHGTPGIYENEELVAVAEVLVSSSYMDTTLTGGTDPDWLIHGKQRYIEERVPGSTIYTAMNVLGWPEAPGTQPSWAETALPTWSFLYEALLASADVEFGVKGWANHWLTLTGFYWDDANEDGIIDAAEDAWIDIVDPWTGTWDRVGIWHYGVFMLIDLWGGNSVIGTAVTERPVPEPSSILLAGIGLLGLAGLGRSKRRAA
jgi:hypothetical protein